MDTEEKGMPLQEEVNNEEAPVVEVVEAEGGPAEEAPETEETPVEENPSVEESEAEENAEPEADAVEENAEPETDAVEENAEADKAETAEAEELPPEQALPEMTVSETATVEAPKKKGMSKVGKTFLIIGIVLTALVLAAGLAGFLYFNRLYKLSNYQRETSVIETVADTGEEDEEESTGETLADAEKEALAESIREAQRAARESWKAAQSEKEASEKGKTKEAEEETEEQFMLREEGVSNILLIGMDEAGGNSDAIIICSIDYTNKKITLTSIMRDTAAYIPGYGARKINSAAAIAGPPLLVQTVEENFMVDIDNYAMVNFQAMKAVIDALGGVDMYITVAEAEFMKIEIPEDRVIHMTGKMAVRHSRDRTSGGYDYGRTQRQKNVLLAIIDKARSGGLGDLNKAAETVLPYITHDFSRSDLLSIMMNLPELIGFDFEQARIPFDGLYHNEGEFLVVDTAATVQKLKEIIYGE